jgi:hypothetical protein
MNINEINEAFDRGYEIHSKDPVYRIIRACGSSTANSGINVFALEKIIEDIKAEERERIKPEEKQSVVRWLWAKEHIGGEWMISPVFRSKEEALKTFNGKFICLEYTRTEFPE